MGMADSAGLRVRDAIPADAAPLALGAHVAYQHGAMMFHRHADPTRRRRGIGTVPLHPAITAHPAAPSHLFCFARNAGSRAFHEAHGFRPVAFRDGAANEEGEADIARWRDAGPVLPIPREDMP